MKNNSRFTQGPVGRQLFFMTIPMVIGLGAHITFNLIDTYFVSQLGTLYLAAMSFTFPVVLGLFSVAIGIGIATASVVSRAFGEDNREKVQQLTTDSFIIAICAALGLSILGLLTMKPLFTLMGATSEVLPYIEKYMRIWYFGTPVLIIPLIGNNALRASGETITPAIIMVIAALINVILDPILIFGLFGFPRLELEGAALASIFGRLFVCFISLSVLFYRKKMITLARPSFKRLIDSGKHILFIALPAMCTHFIVPLAAAIMTRFSASFGPEAVAAVGMGGKIDGFAFIIIIALSTVFIPFIGQNWGAREYTRIHDARIIIFRFTFLWGLLASTILLISGEQIARLFSSDTLVQSYMVIYLIFVPLSYGLRGIAMLAADLFNALNKPFTSTFLSLTRWIILSCGFAYIGKLFFGVVGIIVGIFLGNAVAGFLALWLTHHTCEHVQSQQC